MGSEEQTLSNQSIDAICPDDFSLDQLPIGISLGEYQILVVFYNLTSVCQNKFI